MKLPVVVYSEPDDPLSRFRTDATERTNAGDPLSRRHCAKYHCLIPCVGGREKGFNGDLFVSGGMPIIEPAKGKRCNSENKTAAMRVSLRDVMR